MKASLLMLVVVCCSSLAVGVEVHLEPVSAAELGEWARIDLPFRLHPVTPGGASYDGPPLVSQLWGELSLGEAEYVLLLGVGDGGEVDLWVSDDGRMEEGAELVGKRGSEYYRWDVGLIAQPSVGDPFEYELGIIWPEGRGYVFLAGGAARLGELELDGEMYSVALVDADISGEFGTDRDFYAVDWTQDGKIHADPGGHERFSLDEAVTIGEQTFLVEEIAPDGMWMKFSPTEYKAPRRPLIPGYPAPDFTFQPFRDRPQVSLSDYAGKVVLLDFWATWCVPCMEGLPRMREIYQTYLSQGFEIIGISLDTSDETLRQVLEDKEVEWVQYFDGKGWETEIAELYRVHSTPHLLLLDQDGVIHTVNPSLGELPRLIEDLLGNSAPHEADGEGTSADVEPAPDPEPEPETDLEEEEEIALQVSPLVWLALGVGVAILLLAILQEQ